MAAAESTLPLSFPITNAGVMFFTPAFTWNEGEAQKRVSCFAEPSLTAQHYAGASEIYRGGSFSTWYSYGINLINARKSVSTSAIVIVVCTHGARASGEFKDGELADPKPRRIKASELSQGVLNVKRHLFATIPSVPLVLVFAQCYGAFFADAIRPLVPEVVVIGLSYGKTHRLRNGDGSTVGKCQIHKEWMKWLAEGTSAIDSAVGAHFSGDEETDSEISDGV